MAIILFFVILSLLVIVHELGHFSVAKYFGIRVDEFGLGYPPRAKKLFRWKGTDFTLNWLPFGGFVKIFGENPSEEPTHSKASDNFQHKNRGIQAAVLAAGVFFNFLFAWLLISIGFVTGLPAPAGLDLPIEDARTVITTILPGSPAGEAGLKSGDAILSLSRGGTSSELTPQALSDFIARSHAPLEISIARGDSMFTRTITPSADLLPDRPALGISMETVGIVRLPIHQAIWAGLKTTFTLTYVTAAAIFTLIAESFAGKADLSAVTGPVGIVGMVGDMQELGLGYLITFTALLSINLSIINLMPFPALDGGRLLFVGIEAITRRPIPARLFNAVNAAGFALLIFLMILITIRDVRNIF